MAPISRPAPFVLILAAVVVLLPLLSFSTADSESLIRKMCRASKPAKEALCDAILLSDPRAAACNDEPCVAQASILYTIKNASETRLQARRFLEESPPPAPDVAEALISCSETYATAMTYLNLALVLLENYNYAGAEESMIIAGYNAGNCEDAFQKHPGPMTLYNWRFQQTLGVAMNLVVYVQRLSYRQDT